MTSRKLAVAGQFYPDKRSELNQYLEHFNRVLTENNIEINTNLDVRGIIVPHAGYIYSGFTANLAYKYIPQNIKRVIVIGPSHKFGFKGASVSLYENYPTPFGDLKIDQEFGKQLVTQYKFLSFYDEVHTEHSTETQFPFIKHYNQDVSVLEIIYSECHYNELGSMVEELLKDKENFVVISSDLSHFYTLEEAKEKDIKCLEAIEKRDIGLLNNGCEACGMIGIKAILQAINNLNLNTKFLDYRTSADVSNNEEDVVGYTSFVIHS